ncbi:ABC transporter permease [Rhodococcus daqingensis]|uniref:ABC transporter permease n=1 Tax=Rhodococcus daqingensis TaxID=2479363 RepID=A0ABW2RTK8_9NOCA
MTTQTVDATTTPPRTEPESASRIGAVLRVHTVAWPLLIAWPVGLLAVSFLLSYTIYFIVQNDQDEGFAGGVFSLYGLVIAFYLQAMTQTFPFALGMSVTRREFFTATMLLALAQAAVFAIVLYLLSIVEAATDGWGVRMRMFGLARYLTDSPVLQFLALFSSLLLVAAVAMAAGAIYQRWRVTGLMAAGVGLLGAGGLAAILITWARWWPAIGAWFQNVPRVVPLAVLPLGLSAVAFAVAWTALRRATP